MVPIIIMAGGRGIRLHPLTEDRPKPLFNVGGKPILEQIIDGFTAQGFRSFYLSVNYRADLIEHYFGDGRSRDISIKYIRERKPMGTAGALSLLPALPDGPVIVCNGDVLARLDYRELLRTHNEAKAQATVCLALHQHQIPYGVATFDDAKKFTGLREKPIENVLVNAGIYVLDAILLKTLDKAYCDMPELIGKCDRLAYFPLENAWHDCGSFVDLARANNDWPSTL